MLWYTFSIPLVLHPRNPIRTSDSPAIQLTFAAMFGLMLLAGVWVVWYIRQRQMVNEHL